MVPATLEQLLILPGRERFSFVLSTDDAASHGDIMRYLQSGGQTFLGNPRNVNGNYLRNFKSAFDFDAKPPGAVGGSELA